MSWGLSEFVLMDVLLYLNEVLPTSPTTYLRRARTPFDGMLFEFYLIDPENRLCEHAFVFHVLYGQDEASLLIRHGGHIRKIGV